MSDTATKLYPALLAAMRQMGPVKKDASNPAFRSKYASLQSVLETVEGPLWDNGLLVVQEFYTNQDGVLCLCTKIVHAATEDAILSNVPIVCKDPTDPQKVGGAITYYRRYSLLALLGLAPEDDDGNSAAQPRPTQHAPTRSEKPQEPRDTPEWSAGPPTPVPAPQKPVPGPGIAPDFLTERVTAAWLAFENGKGLDACKAGLRQLWLQGSQRDRDFIESEIGKLTTACAERDDQEVR